MCRQQPVCGVRQDDGAWRDGEPRSRTEPEQQTSPCGVQVSAPMDRHRVAAAICGKPLSLFLEWAAGCEKYPNSYRAMIDEIYAEADRVVELLKENNEPC